VVKSAWNESEAPARIVRQKSKTWLLRAGKIKLSEYSRGHGGNNEQAYAPLVRLAVEIDRITFNMLKTDPFVCKRLSAKRMTAATLSEGFARLIKVRTQMRINNRAGRGFSVSGHLNERDGTGKLSRSQNRIRDLIDLIGDLAKQRAQALRCG
jgi:hypothetical protein